ncbi:MAG: hypothetical protein WCG25_02275 [bacterium]
MYERFTLLHLEIRKASSDVIIQFPSISHNITSSKYGDEFIVPTKLLQII